MKFSHTFFEVDVDTDDLEFFKLLGRLDSIYKQFPKTKCLHCPNKESVESDCCKTFCPPIYFIEFLNILKKIEKTAKEKSQDIYDIVNPLIKKCVDSFLYVEDNILIKPCPALDGINCSFYGQRPFSCRNFGLYTNIEWNNRLEKIIKATEMPKEEIPFYEQCKNIKITDKSIKSLSFEKSNKLFNDVYDLEAILFSGQKKIYRQTYMPLDHHMLLLFLGEGSLEKLTDMKIAYIEMIKKYKNKEISKKVLTKYKNNLILFKDTIKDLL